MPTLYLFTVGVFLNNCVIIRSVGLALVNFIAISNLLWSRRTTMYEFSILSTLWFWRVKNFEVRMLRT